MTRRHLTTTAALVLMMATPLAAQQWEMPPADDGAEQVDPFSLPGRDADDAPLTGLDGIMQNMLNRLQPHLEGIGNELAGTVNEFRPALTELTGVMDDIGNYERPERLPNGDILIRRRADAPPPPPLEELQRLLPEPDGTDPAEGGNAPPALRELPPAEQTEL